MRAKELIYEAAKASIREWFQVVREDCIYDLEIGWTKEDVIMVELFELTGAIKDRLGDLLWWLDEDDDLADLLEAIIDGEMEDLKRFIERY